MVSQVNMFGDELSNMQKWFKKLNIMVTNLINSG